MSGAGRLADLPAAHAAFLENAVAALAGDPRLVGVAAAGSIATREVDEWSDIDLVVAAEPEAIEEVTRDRIRIAAGLGDLLAAFTGEHVGEPRLLICLYGPPLLHVDLKFVALGDAAVRIEDPLILWERDGRLARVLRSAGARPPQPDLQWIEDRFWTWVHYGATKLGRGELFEAIDFLAFLRAQVLGPLAAVAAGARPSGVRRLETAAPEVAVRLRTTLTDYSRASCARALAAAAALYRELRDAAADGSLRRNGRAERAALDYLTDVAARAGGTSGGST